LVHRDIPVSGELEPRIDRAGIAHPPWFLEGHILYRRITRVGFKRDIDILPDDAAVRVKVLGIIGLVLVPFDIARIGDYPAPLVTVTSLGIQP
jgi:hypothetical protein